MHPIIEKALHHLQNANYAGYFREMDKVVPPNMRPVFSEHKGKFVAGQSPHNFYQQLQIFAEQVNSEISTEQELADSKSSKTKLNKVMDQRKMLFIIFADIKGYGSNAGNDSLLKKVTNFLFNLQDEYFQARDQYLSKINGDGIMVAGFGIVDMAEKALNLRDKIKNYNWKGQGFTQNMNVRVALHCGEAEIHYNSDGTIRDVSATSVIHTARLEPSTPVGEVFCSQAFADLLSQQQKVHSLTTVTLGEYNLGKDHDKFMLNIAVLFREVDQKNYSNDRINEFKEHLNNITQAKEVINTSEDQNEEIQKLENKLSSVDKLEKEFLKDDLLRLKKKYEKIKEDIEVNTKGENDSIDETYKNIYRKRIISLESELETIKTKLSEISKKLDDLGG